LTPTQTETQLRHFVDLWPVFDVTPPVVLEAARGVREHSLSFWDAQIWAVAWLNGLSIVLSEDIDAGAEVEGVRFVNPFAAGFRPEDWGL
jgi:predicted nucleic acid-binding protein